MPTTPSRGPRGITVFLSSAILFVFIASASADPKPLSKAEQAKVDRAIDKGVAYLKRTQTKQGNWPTHWKQRYLVGECALPAYALLEAGVPANDPVIQKAAAFIRPRALKSKDTYELALALLFFDRLGDAKDKARIQTLGLRLIAGQYYSGGWSYHCPQLKEKQQADLLKALEELSARMKDGGKSTRESLKDLAVPRGMKELAVFKNLEKFNWLDRPSPGNMEKTIPLVGATDNSNTQFALLALWVAQRHGLPTEPSFRLLVERFERYQCLNGEWSYVHPQLNEGIAVVGLRPGRPSMTCVGLLGLAIGRGLKLTTFSSARPAAKKDGHIVAGLTALYATIGVPTGQMDKPIPADATYKQDIYFLWSVERVAMLFNLPTIGDKEWYRWGAELLVTHQLANGEFAAKHDREEEPFDPTCGGYTVSPGFYGPKLKTAFALLFLKRSHPMKELTPKLPFTAKELNQGVARLRRSAPLERSTTPSRDTTPDR